MDAMYICHPGDNIRSYHRIRSFGYNVIIYPSAKGFSAIRTEGEFPERSYLGGRYTHEGHAKAVRASWYDLICSARGQKDTLLLCECDAVPLVKADVLLPAIKKELEEHPECDVWKLYPRSVMHDEVPDETNAPVEFRDCERHPDETAYNPEVWGTHALIIPDRSRGKIMEIFRESCLPTDVALEWAHGNGMINMREATEPLFIQQIHKTEWEHMPRIACLLSSYKRLKELQRQIYCFMDQSYKNFHLFVAVKGVSEADVVDILMPTFAHFIDEGRLTLRMAPNRNQVSNLIDCIRGIDVSEFDLFAKIDDDDIYSRDYLGLVAEFASFLPKGVGSFYHGFGGFLVKDGTFSHSAVRWFAAWGPTLCVPPQCMQTLCAVEKHPELAFEICRGTNERHFGFAEDLILHVLNMKSGAANRAPYAVASGRDKSLCICVDNDSTTRGGYLSDDFSEVTKNLNNNKKNDEYVLSLENRREPRLCVVRGDMAEFVDKKPYETFNVVAFENGSYIELEAMDGTHTRYEHGPRGIYICSKEKNVVKEHAEAAAIPEENNDITYKIID